MDKEIHEVVLKKYNNKQETLRKKLKALVTKKTSKNNGFSKPILIKDFVVNESTAHFTEEEMDFLNLGLNYALKENKIPVEDIIIDIESSIQFQQFDVKQTIRKQVKEELNNLPRNLTHVKEIKILESIKSKNCVFMKADKGNKIVIMDKLDYENSVNDLIAKGPYEKVKNPMNKLNNKACEIQNECKRIYNLHPMDSRWKVSNPICPNLHCLRKIHKPNTNEKPMRPICSNINAPTEKMSKWLVRELKKVAEKNPPFSFSIKNSIHKL